MSVFVVGLNGCRLMPTSERKARLLLKQGKAFVEQKVPFTIRLNYKTEVPHS
ncbi:MAG: RRXRR domain-containing protein [Anaerostipes hadrus]